MKVVRKPKCSVSIAGEEFDASQIRLEARVGNVVTGSIAGVAGQSDAVRKALASTAVSRMAGLQDLRLKRDPEPNATIQYYDGNTGTINFKGFIGAPNLTVNKMQAGEACTVTGWAGILNALDLSIYSPIVVSTQSETEGGVFASAEDSISSGDVIGALEEITNTLVSSYEQTIDRVYGPKKVLIARQHSMNNRGPLEVWRKLLTKSTVMIPELSNLQEMPTIKAQAVAHMVRVMQSPGAFMQNLSGLLSMFCMFYAPQFDDIGEIKLLSNKIDTPEGATELEVLSLNVSDGSTQLFPLSSVLMLGGGAKSTYAETDESSPADNEVAVLGYYPKDTNSTGYIYKLPPPPWIIDPRTGSTLIAGDTMGGDKAQETGSGKPRDLGEFENALKGRAEAIKLTATKTNSVMDALAKLQYYDLQYASSTARFSIAPDVRIPVGERITVKCGDLTITGFVDSVTHDILVTKDSLSVSSAVDLTHVKF